MLRVKLQTLDAWTDRRRAIAAAYSQDLSGAELILPHVPDWAEPAWHLYVVRAVERSALQQRLTKAGIQTLIHYPIPPHEQAAYDNLRIALDTLPISSQLAKEVLSLPMGPHLSVVDAGNVAEAAQSAG